MVYPALDSKVKNVTSAYSREHEDEVRCRGYRCKITCSDLAVITPAVQEHLFEQLSKLLAAAISQTGKDQLATVR